MRPLWFQLQAGNVTVEEFRQQSKPSRRSTEQYKTFQNYRQAICFILQKDWKAKKELASMASIASEMVASVVADEVVSVDGRQRQLGSAVWTENDMETFQRRLRSRSICGSIPRRRHLARMTRVIRATANLWGCYVES